MSLESSNEKKMIGCFPHLGFGMPTIIGRRLTVYNVVTKLFYENTIEEAIEDYEISIDQAKAAIEYCIDLQCQKDLDRIQFCDGCILSTIEEGYQFDKDDYVQIDDQITVSKDGHLVFFDTLDQLKEETFGKPGWAIASQAKKKII